MRSPSFKKDPHLWGCLLKAIRNEKSVSQRDLASLSGIARSTIKRIEDGKTKPTIEVLEVLFWELGYEMDLHIRGNTLQPPDQKVA